jgi:hypothetical protein
LSEDLKYLIFNFENNIGTVPIGKRIKKHELEEGDLVFSDPQGASNAWDLSNNEFVHTSSRNREVRSII